MKSITARQYEILQQCLKAPRGVLGTRTEGLELVERGLLLLEECHCGCNRLQFREVPPAGRTAMICFEVLRGSFVP